jgi:cytoskeletal protein CcmA (bactofilin family)
MISDGVVFEGKCEMIKPSEKKPKKTEEQGEEKTA